LNGWVDGDIANDGLLLKESTENTDQLIDFRSMESTNGGQPYISVVEDPASGDFSASPTGWSGASSGTVTLSNIHVAAGLSPPNPCNVRTSTNGGAWVPQGTVPATGNACTYTVTSIGTTHVQFQVVDKDGNTSSWVPTTAVPGSTIQLDGTPPTPPDFVAADSSTWIKAESEAVTASGATDADSGIDHYEYETSTNGGTTYSSPQWATYVGNGQWKAVIRTEGTTLARFRSVDAVGLVSSWVGGAGATYIDRTPPNAPLVNGGSDAWQAGPETRTASGSYDSLGAPRAGYQYEESTDGGATWSAASPGSTDTVTSSGRTMVRFRAYDTLGNDSPWSSSNVRIDSLHRRRPP